MGAIFAIGLYQELKYAVKNISTCQRTRSAVGIYGTCFFLYIQYVVAYTCRIAFMVSLVFFFWRKTFVNSITIHILSVSLFINEG